MSSLLQSAPRDGSGRVLYTDGGTAPSHAANGLPYEVDGSLAVANLGVISHHHNGLPFTATGRIVVNLSASVDRYGPSTAPLDTNGRIAINSGLPDNYVAGVGFSSGQVSGVSA